jgi:phospholipase A1
MPHATEAAAHDVRRGGETMRASVGAAALLLAILPGGLLAAPRADASDPGQADASDPGQAAVAQEEPSQEEGPSFFTHLWQLDRKTRAGRPAVTFHRTNYILVFSYNGSPNQDPWQALDPPQELVKPEATFQLSFKAKVWQDVFDTDTDLWVAYTQRSFWQVYNFDESSPFRETNYEPELLLNFRTRFSLLGLTGRFIQIGLNHQSNGQTEPLSRSWNRVVANLGLERGRFSLLVKGWYRLPETAEEDDNPGMYDYLGYGEIWGYYLWNGHRAAVMLRDNLDFDHNRGAIQLEWSFPLFKPSPHTPTQVGGYVQWFLGYGESLLDYDHRVNRIGVGIAIAEWN